MKILVTGAGGYIGSVLVPLLIENGHIVRAVDRFFFGRETLPAPSQSLEIIEEDIRSVDSAVFKDIDAVIDLAALSNDPSGELDPVRTWSINHLGRLRIAALAKANGAKRYILPSSCSVYGFQDGVVDENSPTHPLTVYAEANLKAEEDVLTLGDEGFCVTVIRQATVYGFSPRMRFDLAINGMVKGFFKQGKLPLLRDGTQWRPFVHVRDTCKAMLMLLNEDPARINKARFNVGSNEQNYQVFDLAQRVAKAAGLSFEYEWYGSPDQRSYQVNFNKLRETTDWTPDYNAETGTEEVWQALRAGKISVDDPRTITVEWYKKLLNENADI